MILALPAIRKVVPNVRYEIVGDGPQRAQLELLARRLAVADSIIFHGSVDDDALVGAYGRAHCFSLPTRRIHDDVEGFGIVFLEAAMSGLATIGGRESGATDIIEHGITGFIVDGSNLEEISEAVIRLLLDPAEAVEMGRRGYARAKRRWSWSNIAYAIDGSKATQ